MRKWTLKESGAVVNKFDKRLWDLVAEGYGLKKDDHGKRFHSSEDDTTYTITGVNPSSKVRPICVTSADNKKWCFPVARIKEFRILNKNVDVIL